MRIFCILCLEAAPWGGSEELWYLIANELLDKGNELIIDRIHWEPVPHKLQQLIDKGANVLYRPNYHLKKSQLDIQFKVKNRLFNHSLIKRLNGISADAIVISQSGTFDTYFFRIAPFLIQTRIPFVIISQLTPESIYLDDLQRDIAKAIF